MREVESVLFRGKRLENKRWAIGYLIASTTGQTGVAFHVGDFGSHDSDFTIKLVYPETIGQFTGLHDKNGTDIYEGDLLKYQDGEIRYVTFSNGCFMANREGPNGVVSIQLSPGAIVEIVGNIYDNPSD